MQFVYFDELFPGNVIKIRSVPSIFTLSPLGMKSASPGDSLVRFLSLSVIFPVPDITTAADGFDLVCSGHNSSAEFSVRQSYITNLSVRSSPITVVQSDESFEICQ